jgi:hypothetical protein
MTFKKFAEYYFIFMAALLIFSTILGGKSWVFPLGLQAALHVDEKTSPPPFFLASLANRAGEKKWDHLSSLKHFHDRKKYRH